MRTFDLVYNLCWTPAAAAMLPFSRMDGKAKGLRRLIWQEHERPPRPGGIWLHALSVGETMSAVPLARALRRVFPDRPLVVSASTEKGLALARVEMAEVADRVLGMPFDFWRPVRRMMDYIRPSVFVLVETDIWPGILGLLKDRGIPALLVNGRVSPRTARGYRRAAPLLRPVFDCFRLCLMQTARDRQRLLAPRLIDPERCEAVGNIKFDREWPPMEAEERLAWLRRLSLSGEETLWVAGSTHPGEEAVLMDVYRELRNRFPGLRLVIAPRDISRADELAGMAREKGLQTSLRSVPRAGAGIILLDTVGELGRVYGLAAVAFVGGSLVPVGGHNLLEPAAFACPVLFGPHTHNFEDMADALSEEGGGMRIRDRASLHEAVSTILSDDGRRRQAGSSARAFVMANRGALDRVIERIGRCAAEAVR